VRMLIAEFKKDNRGNIDTIDTVGKWAISTCLGEGISSNGYLVVKPTK
jgi:hypothetical protein